MDVTGPNGFTDNAAVVKQMVEAMAPVIGQAVKEVTESEGYQKVLKKMVADACAWTVGQPGVPRVDQM